MAVKLTQKKPEQPLAVLVSSTVYGIEELLERVYAVLTRFGYDVWMSHKGTVPVFSNRTAFDNCLKAVEKCDLFLGILTTHYGSGKETKDKQSITHQETLKAIQLNKPRWFLAHDHLPFARTLLSNLGYGTTAKRAALNLKKNPVIDDLRVIDMYEAAIRHDSVTYQDKKGNWVQKFSSPEEALLFASAQFHRYHEVEAFVKEQFESIERVEKEIQKGGTK
jgi:hypothetical protein